mmetsp:Transcript_38188/g.96678  ORF Transcript_38188/g.96678 Transcript_38188/m.96678 type:complete len:227 (+) Transcript_38188:201-881(+)
MHAMRRGACMLLPPSQQVMPLQRPCTSRHQSLPPRMGPRMHPPPLRPSSSRPQATGCRPRRSWTLLTRSLSPGCPTRPTARASCSCSARPRCRPSTRWRAPSSSWRACAWTLRCLRAPRWATTRASRWWARTRWCPHPPTSACTSRATQRGRGSTTRPGRQTPRASPSPRAARGRPATRRVSRWRCGWLTRPPAWRARCSRTCTPCLTTTRGWTTTTSWRAWCPPA